MFVGIFVKYFFVIYLFLVQLLYVPVIKLFIYLFFWLYFRNYVLILFLKILVYITHRLLRRIENLEKCVKLLEGELAYEEKVWCKIFIIYNFFFNSFQIWFLLELFGFGDNLSVVGHNE